MEVLGEDEILHIFMYLDARNLVKAGQVCKNWYWLSRSNSLWYKQCMRRWSFCNLSHIERSADIWYKYFSRRSKIDHKVESGRPGLDYKVKSIRSHKSVIKGVLYITANKIYTSDLTKNEVAEPLVASWDETTLAMYQVSDGKQLWAVTLDNYPTRKVLYFNKQDALMCTSQKGVIILLTSLNGVQCGKISTNKDETEISAVAVIPESIAKLKAKGVASSLLCVALCSGKCQVWDLGNLDSPKFVFFTLSNIDALSVSTRGLIASTSHSFGEVRIHDFNSFVTSSENEKFLSIQVLSSQNILEDNMPHLRHFPTEQVTKCCWFGKSQQFLAVKTFNSVSVFDLKNNGAGIDFNAGTNSCQIGCFQNMLLLGDFTGTLTVHYFTDDGGFLGKETLKDHVGAISGIHIDPYRVVTCSKDFSIRIYKWQMHEGTGNKLASLYTLLGGSHQYSTEGFLGLVCDLGSCVGWTSKVIKCYAFLQ